MKLTADDIRDLIERHSWAIGGTGRNFENGAYREIADELNAALGRPTFNADLEQALGGRLTAEQVRETVEKHWHDLPSEYDMPEATALPEYSYDWHAIADELNAAFGDDEKLAERENSKLEHKLSNMETKLLKAQERIDGLLEQKVAAIGGGECEMEELERFDGSDPHYRCKACRHENYEDYLPRFCPSCGKAVKR